MWLIDTGRDRADPLNVPLKPRQRSPLWSPDGSRVVFRSSARRSSWTCFEKAASGAGDEQPLLVTGEPKIATGLVPRRADPALRDPASEDRSGPLGRADGRRPQAVPGPANSLRRNLRAVLPRRAVGGVSVERIQTQCRFTSDRFLGPAASGRCRRRAGASRGGGPTGRNCSMSLLDGRLMAVPIAVRSGPADAGGWRPGGALPDRLASGANISGVTSEAAVRSRLRRALSDERVRRGSDRATHHRRPQLGRGVEEVTRTAQRPAHPPAAPATWRECCSACDFSKL